MKRLLLWIVVLLVQALAPVQAQGLSGPAGFVPVVAALTGITGMPVPDVDVEWHGPRGSLLRARSDRQGLAHVALPAAEIGTWTVRASGPGYVDTSSTLDLDGAGGSPASPPRVEMEIKRAGETLLEVRVKDSAGNPAPNVPIEVQHQRALGGGPTYQGITGPDGVARIAVKPGRTVAERLSGTELRVSARNPAADAPDARAAVSTQVTISYHVPRKVADLILLAASADPTTGMPVRVRVMAEGAPVPGATVVLQGRDASERRSASTDAQGQALVEATVIFAGRFGIEASKDGYVSGRAVVSLDPRNRGKQIEEVALVLKPLPAMAGALPLRVEVRDRVSRQTIIGAAVRLTPQSGDKSAFGGVTGSDGIAPLISNATGAWQLEVSHDQFVTHRSTVVLERKEATLNVLLDARPQDKAENSTLTVQVSAADRKDSSGRALPLPGATLRWGNSSMVTDAEGKASIGFSDQLGLSFSVEAPNYQPAQGSVDGSRYPVVRQHTRRVLLEPAPLTAASPFTLIIRTEEDAEPREPIPFVPFKLWLPDGRLVGSASLETGASGESRPIEFGADVAALARQGLIVEVGATAQHGPARQDIRPELLRPSADPSRYVVQLTSFFARDLAALNAEVVRLEALKQTVQTELENAWHERDTVQALAGAIQAQIQTKFGGQVPPTSFQQMQREADQACERAARTAREHVRSSEVLGRQSVDLIEAAQREAAQCSKPESADRIDALQQLLAVGLNELKRQSASTRQEAQDFLARASGLEQEAGDPLERTRETLDDLQRAAAGAAAHMANARAAAARLKAGHAAAVTRLNELRARKALTPAQFGRTVEPRRRLTPLPFDLEPPNDPALLARRDADAMNQQWQQLQARAALFGKQGCSDARAGFPRAVDTVEANLAALAFTVTRADLPGLAQTCRDRVANGPLKGLPGNAPTAPAAQASPAADNAMVTVPDVAGVPRPQWPQAVQAAGLSWGGEIQVAQPAPSAAKSQGFASQSLIPGTQVRRGVPLSVFVWGPYVAAPGDQATSTPATEAPTAVPPASTTGPSIWERLLRGAAAATPGIVAAVQQSRGQRPAPSAPAVTPAAVPQAPPQPAAAGTGVPNVWGDSLEQAQRKLEAAGVALRGISRGGKPPSPDLSGRVYHQNPAAGTAVMRGMAADLMIYDNDRSAVTPPAPAPAAATTRYDRPTQGGLPIHQCATAGPWPNGDCGNEGAEYFCVKYKGHQRVFGFKTYTVAQSFRLRDGTRCVQGLCPAFLEVVCQ